MLDIKLIRENPDRVKLGVKSKGISPKLVDDFLALDEKWRKLTQESENLRAEQKKAGEAKDVAKAKKLKEKISGLNEDLEKTGHKRDILLLEFPNLPFEDVPVGKDESSNKVLREVGDKPDLKNPSDYSTLAEKLDLIDTEKAGAISGSRFGYLKNEAVLLEFALIDLAMKTLVKEGFSPILPPVLVKPEIMKAMGKQKFIAEKDAYYLPEDNLYLVGSSEHSIGPYHMSETLSEADLPKRYVGFSTCFRREAGSYGKDTKGFLRVHQFDKVEMVVFSKPEDSEKEHQKMLALQEKLMQTLELPYRVVEICSGDMTFADARQFDIEAWFPSQGEYRETHSCSNTTDYQARGLNTRYKSLTPSAKGGSSFGGNTSSVRPQLQAKAENLKPDFVHILNGTVFSGRPILAIIENFQTPDGKIKIPKILQDYVGKKEIGFKN